MVWNKGMPVIWWYVMKEFNWKWKQMDSICNYAQNTSFAHSWLWNGLFRVFPDLTRIFGIYGGQYAPHNASWVQGFRNVGAESKGSYPWYVFQAASPWGITAFCADLFADMGYRPKNNVFPHFSRWILLYLSACFYNDIHLLQKMFQKMLQSQIQYPCGFKPK